MNLDCAEMDPWGYHKGLREQETDRQTDNSEDKMRTNETVVTSHRVAKSQ